ncbi:hypothetical protein BKE38_19805 [Pseudoroseomonas deserti]|uniref:Uncharacterized protein n=1 Tax=Teichococcus deserti TaxID=1817963 RepID=A0A1V2GY09_9PROT|nr:hypothetical protein [Pseudoroseomonas deserti]ONG50034.1 hypothetical protein BKE38_19805 [Pseudoroseomonas deserti]
MPRQLALQAALALSFFAAAGSLPALAQRGPQQGPLGIPDPSFEIVNNTDRGLEQLFANPVGVRDWGHDRLGAQWVPPGARHVVRLDPRGGCRQDLRLVWRGGGVDDLRDVDTCAQRQIVLGPPLPVPLPGKMAPGYAAPQGMALRLENRGGRPITLAFATPSGQPDWGQDLLLGRTLRAGARQSLALPPGPCLYDVKVIFADGAVQEARGLDLCARPAVRFP